LSSHNLYTTLDADADPASHVNTCSKTFLKSCVLVLAPAGKGLSQSVGTALANKIPDVKLVDVAGLIASASSVLSDASGGKFAAELYRVQMGMSLPSPQLLKELLVSCAKKNGHCSSFILTNFLPGGETLSSGEIRDLVDTLAETLSVKQIVYCKFLHPDGSTNSEALSQLSEPEDLSTTVAAVDYLKGAGFAVEECTPDLEVDFEPLHFANRVAISLQ